MEEAEEEEQKNEKIQLEGEGGIRGGEVRGETEKIGGGGAGVGIRGGERSWRRKILEESKEEGIGGGAEGSYRRSR